MATRVQGKIRIVFNKPYYISGEMLSGTAEMDLTVRRIFCQRELFVFHSSLVKKTQDTRSRCCPEDQIHGV